MKSLFRASLLLAIVTSATALPLRAESSATSAAPAPALSAAAPSGEARHSDHEELRALLKTATEAFDTREMSALAPFVAERVFITTVDGRSFTSLAEFKSYLDELNKSSVKKIEFHPAADELTTFLDEDDGVCRGSSNDSYTFADGDVRQMKSRWTATVHRDGGRWKLVSLHISANLLDNPVVDTAKKQAGKLAGLGLVAGIAIGYLLRMVTKRS